MKLSIVIPVYNEEKTLTEILNVIKGVTLPSKITDYEIVIVDDCSTDKTRSILKKIKDKHIKVFYHEENTGKGGALQTGFQKTTGDIVIIQDADLEYDPNEYSKLFEPILRGYADVVYGSRFVGGDSHRVLYFWHTVMNKFLTLMSNVFSDLNLTDMETCYKVFRGDIIRNMEIEEKRFGFEPEITAKLGSLVRKNEIKMFEVGISYNGRTYDEGKKINWRDGVHAISCIYKYNDSQLAHFIKYFVNGLLVAMTQLLVSVLLIHFSDNSTVLSQSVFNFVGIEVGVLVGFLLHYKFTWRYVAIGIVDFLKTFGLFHIVTGLSVLIRILLFPVFASFGVHYVLNILIGIVIAIVVNFIGYDKWVFKKIMPKEFI
jgi:glycosyltransferase involved in cell wall biosynthesis